MKTLKEILEKLPLSSLVGKEIIGAVDGVYVGKVIKINGQDLVVEDKVNGDRIVKKRIYYDAFSAYAICPENRR